MQFKHGDILAWKREGDDDALRCEILQIRDTQPQRACLRVEGWLGTHWETLNSSFELYSAWEAKQAAKAADRRAAKRAA